MQSPFRKWMSALLALGCLAFSFSLWAAEKFASPEQAQQALVQALAGADPESALKKIFGPEASDLWTSGDAAQDQERRQAFLKRAAEQSSWSPLGKDRTVLLVGQDQWSFPIPLKRQGKSWAFDTKTGREEILNRRIGANELDAIAGAEDYARAQQEYFQQDRNGDGVKEYAQRFVSDPGQKNGLYWDSKDPRATSPVGPAIGQATIQDLPGGERRLIHHGYYFQALGEQSKKAPGGAKSFIQDGKQTQGFALLAYPMSYGSSGIMSFLVGPDGRVLQKDLGRGTAKTALKMTEYDPDSSWKPVHQISANRPIIKP
ncbi:MAG TPA: DUF2950 domain-containing protein [bacterium]|nr:DUF2950 domain-containing protein [bacterium]